MTAPLPDAELSAARDALALGLAPVRLRELLLLREGLRQRGRACDLRELLGGPAPRVPVDLQQALIQQLQRPASEDPPSVRAACGALASAGQDETATLHSEPLRPGRPPPAGDARAARARGLEAYRAARRLDPHFAPHADAVLERLEVLGQGGMGVVHRVRDHRLGREAALKTLHAETSDAGAVARFLREAEVTARLDHPAIPPVYEAGTDAAGRHYLLMRLIEGDPLSERIAARDRRDPAVRRELLEALVRVGEAVAYAHSQGVVHRDLKPQNVMVGRFGEVLVLDWGLARVGQAPEDERALRAEVTTLAEEDPPAAPAAGPAGLTQAGALLGTPGYMPPEQCEDPAVDARADVFALGAILCELLCGRPPIAGENALNRVHATVTGNIATPRRLDPHVPPELDAIAARALAADPEARTPSAEALVADLQAYLAGGEVSVYRYSPRERLLRAARRHPALLIGGTLLGLLLGVSGLLGTLLVQSNRQRRQAQAEQAAAEGERRLAQAARARFERAMARLAEAEDLAHHSLEDAQVQAKVEEALAEERARFLLWHAAGVYEEARLWGPARALLEDAVTAHPPGYRELFQLHRLELLERGRRGFAWSDPLRRLVALAEQRGETNEFVAFARGSRAQVRGDLDAALRHYEEALRLSPRFALVHVHRATAHATLGELEAALDDCDRALELEPGLPLAYLDRAAIHGRLGQHRRALRDLERALELGERDVTLWYDRGVARARLGDPRGSLEDADRALEADPRHAASYALRANAQRHLGDLAAALEDVSRALELDPRLPVALENRAAIHRLQGRIPAALADIEQALALAPDDADLHYERGRIHQAAGDPAAARAAFARSLERNPRHRDALLKLGLLELRSGDPAAAAAVLDRALVLDPRSAEAYANRALAREALGQRREALEDHTRALELDPRAANAWLNRAITYRRLGELHHALADASHALRLDSELVEAWAQRAAIRDDLGQYREAIEDCTRALELAPRSVQALTNRGVARFHAGDFQGAVADADAALALEPTRATLYVNRGSAYQKLGQLERTIADWERFLELAPEHPDAGPIRRVVARLRARAGSAGE